MTGKSSSPFTVNAPPDRFFGYYPGTVAVITAAYEGEQNVMSAGWHSALSAEPPLYGVAVAPKRYTYGLIKASGTFALHFLPFEHAEAIAGVGSMSRHEGKDKFELLGLSRSQGVVIDAPVLSNAYLAYECQVENVHPVGDHDWFVGRVVAIHYKQEAFTEGLLKKSGVQPAAVYYGRSLFESLGQGEQAELIPERFLKKDSK